jgi:hypothetical protein
MINSEDHIKLELIHAAGKHIRDFVSLYIMWNIVCGKNVCVKFRFILTQFLRSQRVDEPKPGIPKHFPD